MTLSGVAAVSLAATVLDQFESGTPCRTTTAEFLALKEDMPENWAETEELRGAHVWPTGDVPRPRVRVGAHTKEETSCSAPGKFQHAPTMKGGRSDMAREHAGV